MRLKLWLTLRDRRYNQGTWEGRALKFSSAAQGTVAWRFDIEENDLRLISGKHPNAAESQTIIFDLPRPKRE